MNKKVVILCPYSYPSACGIWSRVYSDAKALINEGYEVHVFSSNIIKGTNKTSSSTEELEGIHLHRFNVRLKLGGTSMIWFFRKEFNKINPDIIHTHGYRHPHSFQSFIFSKIKKKPVFITTHGPFEKDTNRTKILKIIDTLYDNLIGRFELKRYNSVIILSNWERKYLKRFNVKKIEEIPNGINHKFITKQIPENYSEIKNQVIYMGRIDPVKRLEWIKYASKKLTNLSFKIIGPIQGYDKFTTNSSNLEIISKKYNEEDFIEEVDNSDIFVLPSIRESFGLVLVEAMSRGKIVISSDTKGANDIINNGVNGFLIQSKDELIEAIEYTYKNWEKLGAIRVEAINTGIKYDENNTTKLLIALYNTLYTV